MERRALELGFSITCGLLLVGSAGMLASGVSAIVEYSLLTVPSLPVLRARSMPAALNAGVGADAILHRNPFDSTTGPLDTVVPEADPTPSHVDPLTAPDCEQVDVYSTMESSDPYWSSAVIQGEKEVHGQVRRPGDQVDGRRVIYIGYNPRLRSPAVWFESGGSLCQSALFDGKPRRSSAPVKKAPPSSAPKKPSPGKRLPESIARKIVRKSPTEFDVERSVVDTIMRDYAKLMRGTRMRPVKKNGKLIGLGLRGIRGDSLLGSLGLRDGDQIQSINGFALTSPEKALQAYARLRTADKLVVQVVRGEKPLALDYRIR